MAQAKKAKSKAIMIPRKIKRTTEVFSRSYLFQQEGRYKGNTLRTHAGGVWLNGYSDHLPVIVYLLKEAK